MPAYYDQNSKSWYCKFYYSDYTGQKKQKLKRGFKLQRDAKEWERSFLETCSGSPDMLFGNFVSVYLADCEKRLRPGSVKVKRAMINAAILPYFKDKPLNAITPAAVRKWENDILSVGYSESHLHNVSKTFSIMLNFAVKYYGLPVNPFDTVGHIGRISKSVSFWTLDQYRLFRSSVYDPELSVIYDLLFFGGFRVGELLAITLADCDFEGCMININKTDNGHGSTGPTKTENSNRVVSIPPAIMEALAAYTKKIYALDHSEPIFTASRYAIRETISKQSERLNLPVIRIHDLRHSHVSLLINMGINPYAIADRIGDTVSMVNNTYGHLYPERRDEIAEKLQILVSN